MSRGNGVRLVFTRVTVQIICLFQVTTYVFKKRFYLPLLNDIIRFSLCYGLYDELNQVTAETYVRAETFIVVT